MLGTQRALHTAAAQPHACVSHWILLSIGMRLHLPLQKAATHLARRQCRITHTHGHTWNVAAGSAFQGAAGRNTAAHHHHPSTRLHSMASQKETLIGYHMPSEAELQDLVEDAVVWANQHGLLVALAQKGVPEKAAVHAPIAALPVTFPRERFLQAKAAQTLLNQLMDAVARDEAYLEQTLAAAALQDEFTARLLKLLRDTRSVRAASAAAGRPEIALGIHRSDYMLDAPSQGFLQVEFNTIASSFGCLSSLVTRLHTYIASRAPAHCGIDTSRLPPNPAIEGIPDALAAAAKAHGAAGGMVVMVVQPGERNAYDQQWLQLQLWERHRLRTLRRTMAQIAAAGMLDAQGNLSMPLSMTAADALTPQPGTPAVPVSVVYFRAGYVPTDYPTESEWTARSIVERSNAAKCPTAAYQLAGAKKVQQDLARPGVLERFVSKKEDAVAIRSLFAGLWGLDDLQDPDTAAIVHKAIHDPDAYVLKPQREGGGNNFYGPELASKLKDALNGPRDGLSAYILMQKIKPPPQSSVLVRAGQAQAGQTLSELGVYGTFLRQGDVVHHNNEVGHLVRTKFANSNEGGVAAGFAVLDSPCLID